MRSSFVVVVWLAACAPMAAPPQQAAFDGWVGDVAQMLAQGGTPGASVAVVVDGRCARSGGIVAVAQHWQNGTGTGCTAATRGTGGGGGGGGGTGGGGSAAGDSFTSVTNVLLTTTGGGTTTAGGGGATGAAGVAGAGSTNAPHAVTTRSASAARMPHRGRADARRLVKSPLAKLARS